MDHQDRTALCAAAQETLAQAPGHRKLALLWAGAAAAAGLLSSLLSLLLDTQIAGTGGLQGMELRSFLSTMQMALGLFVFIALPFWTIGHTAAALEISRTRQAKPAVLLEGFRRFGPALRFFLLQAVVYIALGVVCLNLGNLLFVLSPMATQVMELMTPIMEGMAASADYQPDPAAMDALMAAMLPVMIGNAVLFLILCLPISYRLRMAQLRLMDAPRCGARYAMASSVRMMRGQCLSLFLLDLRFWWFYLAEVAVTVLCYGDILLPLLGVSLPFSQDVGYFLFYCAAMAAQVGLYTFAKNRLAVTYAKFYERILPAA